MASTLLLYVFLCLLNLNFGTREAQRESGESSELTGKYSLPNYAVFFNSLATVFSGGCIKFHAT